MSSKNKQPITPLRLVVAIIVVLVAGYFGIDLTESSDQDQAASPVQPSQTRSAPASASESVSESQRALVELARQERSGQMVELRARVVKLLEVDNDGARHQRFLLAIDLEPSPTDSVLVAHNIDLAPRVPLSEGDVVRVYGQYEFNDRGGVLHWTHHDPGGRHAEGWIEHEGVVYD